ncbi:MAG: hypothetical protein QOG89_1368 [Thermomicrobiales bacterium]|nr:hypothetical protein [Thermomicrobiales bacterium]
MSDATSANHTFAEVRIQRKGERTPSAGQNASMWRDIGVSNETVGSVGIYAAIVTTAPGTRSDVHHHRECETAIYILSGQARFRYGEGLTNSVEAEAGDFVYIPDHAVHTEDNLSETEPLVVLIARNCPGPVVVKVPELESAWS